MWTNETKDKVESLLTQFCTPDEVCAVIGCDQADLDTLSRDAFGEDFAAVAERFAAVGRARLREAQAKLALSGDRAMLQVMGREYLGQESTVYKPKERKAEDKKAATDEPAQRTLRVLQSRFVPPVAANG